MQLELRYRVTQSLKTLKSTKVVKIKVEENLRSFLYFLKSTILLFTYKRKLLFNLNQECLSQKPNKKITT